MFVLALGVRLVHITETDIAGDEPFSIYIAHLGISDIVSQLAKDNSPPLFEILLHYYISWFGVSDFSVRLLPTIFSSFVPSVILLIGFRFFNWRVGIAAALLAVFSIYHIRFAHEVRVYALFSLLTSLSLLAYLSAFRNNSTRWWMALVVFDVLLLYSHYTSFYLIFAQALGALVFVPFKDWKKPIVAFLVVGVCYLPYLFVFLQRLGEVSSGTWVPRPGWGEIYGNINLLLNDKVTTLGVLAAIGIGLSLRKFNLKAVFQDLVSNREGLLVGLSFGIPYVLMFAVSIAFLPMFMDRYVLYTSIPLFLLVAWLVEASWSSNKFSSVGIAILISASIFTTNINPPNNREIKDTVEYLGSLSEDDFEVFVCPEMFRMAVAYHLDKQIFQQVDSEEPIASLDRMLAERNIRFVNSIEQIPAEEARIAYLDAASNFVYPGNQILNELKTSRLLTDSVHFHEIFDVYLFESH